MKHSIIYTSTLSPKLMSWLKDYSKQMKVTKKAIIEFALSKYMEESKRKELTDSFKRAAQDTEIIEMADEGLDDYCEQLTNLEK